MSNPNTLSDHPWLRREAGEGWHNPDLDNTLLKQLVIREIMFDSLAEKDRHRELPPGFPEPRTELQDQIKFIEKLKQEHHIDDPPPPRL